jgi:hypothetical protein
MPKLQRKKQTQLPLKPKREPPKELPEPGKKLRDSQMMLDKP